MHLPQFRTTVKRVNMRAAKCCVPKIPYRPEIPSFTVHLAPEDFLYSSLKYVSTCIDQVVARSAVSTTVPSYTPHIFLD